ncbi:TetR/AcrR family transcriptional regulator [Nocardioides dongkuii]|uniref:TetR/AcrR family transcriptional regulator n=1 Tax=Nocardioides dongkuii TaxID=2760089 RepID=UPI001C6FE634|nr:TetR/AcrR family transcriptional regulator [Nocardioides dongkuii]
MTEGPTRDAIAAAARQQFMAAGYAATSVRGVAAAAGIDPSLVIRHFGSKEQLFLETVEVDGPFAPALEGPFEGMGERLVALVLEDRMAGVLRTPYRAMIRASDSAPVRERLVAAMEATLARPLAARLTGPDAELRAHLVAAQVGGLLEALVILEDPVVLAADPAAVAALYGHALSTLLTPGPG